MTSCQKVPKFDFRNQFSMSNIIWIFLNFFSLKNTYLGAHFFLLTFFDKIIFFLLKWCPIFDSSQLIQDSKFNNFLWVTEFMTASKRKGGKNRISHKLFSVLACYLSWLSLKRGHVLLKIKGRSTLVTIFHTIERISLYFTVVLRCR